MSQAQYNSRSDRAEQIRFEDIRVIDNGHGPTVYEVDAINEKGQHRENLTLIPGIRYEATKDVRYRHSDGVIGKYTRALVRENETAREELRTFIEEERDELYEKINELSEKDSQLLQAILELDSL